MKRGDTIPTLETTPLSVELLIEQWGAGEYADDRWAFVRELNEWVNSGLKSSMKC